PNVVPLLGIDSTTFSPPSRALVSPWMLSELNDIIRGLTYLHNLDVVHGDLCGVRGIIL
ncbi:hypothetical protein B0H13DRAFT_1639741, partial [Mycena leptocephala]